MNLKIIIALVIFILMGYWLPDIASPIGAILLGLGFSPVYFPKMGPFLESKGWPRKYVLIIAFTTLIVVRFVRLANNEPFLD